MGTAESAHTRFWRRAGLTKPSEPATTHLGFPAIHPASYSPSLIHIDTSELLLPSPLDLTFLVVVEYIAKLAMQDRGLHLHLLPSRIRFQCRHSRQNERDVGWEHGKGKNTKEAGTIVSLDTVLVLTQQSSQ
jgi:hypothetical protein